MLSFHQGSNESVQPQTLEQQGLDKRIRSTQDRGAAEHVIGNLLIALALGIFCLMGATFLQGQWQDWLKSQQKTVEAAALDDWPLSSLPVIVPPPPTPPKLTATPVPLAAMIVSSSPTPAVQPTPRSTLAVTPTVAPAVPVRIVIPKISVNSRIVEIAARPDGAWSTAAYAVGHYVGTALLGQSGNMILSGHNNYEGEVFKRLSELAVGDKIQVYSADREYRYTVVNTAIIQWTGASQADRRRHLQYLLPTTDATLTLISCWPYWFYTHRVYIVAKPSP